MSDIIFTYDNVTRILNRYDISYDTHITPDEYITLYLQNDICLSFTKSYVRIINPSGLHYGCAYSYSSYKQFIKRMIMEKNIG